MNFLVFNACNVLAEAAWNNLQRVAGRKLASELDELFEARVKDCGPQGAQVSFPLKPSAQPALFLAELMQGA